MAGETLARAATSAREVVATPCSRCSWMVKATGEQTGGRLSLVEHLVPAGSASPLHVHHTEDESFYVIEGHLTVIVDTSGTCQHQAPPLPCPRGADAQHSLVVGHGGHATTMTALAHDLPLVIMPMHPMLDQAVIGRTLEARGAARVVSKTARPDRIRSAAEEMLRDGPHREAARRLGVEIRRRDGAQEAADCLTALLPAGVVVSGWDGRDRPRRPRRWSAQPGGQRGSVGALRVRRLFGWPTSHIEAAYLPG